MGCKEEHSEQGYLEQNVGDCVSYSSGCHDWHFNSGIRNTFGTVPLSHLSFFKLHSEGSVFVELAFQSESVTVTFPFRVFPCLSLLILSSLLAALALLLS